MVENTPPPSPPAPETQRREKVTSIMQLFVNDQIKISIIHTPGPDGANLLVRPLGGEEGRVVPMARAQIAVWGGGRRRGHWEPFTGFSVR